MATTQQDRHRGWAVRSGVLAGFLLTTMRRPDPATWNAIHAKSIEHEWVSALFSHEHGQRETSPFVSDRRWLNSLAYRDRFAGAVVLTSDGRAIALTGFDFWRNKPRQVTLLGDFLLRLVMHSRVAGIYDVAKAYRVKGKIVRASSEEDVWLLLDNPDLVLAEIEGIASAVQRLNALRAEIAALDTQRSEMDAHMALLAQQAQFAARELSGAQADLASARQQAQAVVNEQLQAVVNEQADKTAQAARLEKTIQTARVSQTAQWVVGGAAALGLGYAILKRGGRR